MYPLPGFESYRTLEIEYITKDCSIGSRLAGQLRYSDKSGPPLTFYGSSIGVSEEHRGKGVSSLLRATQVLLMKEMYEKLGCTEIPKVEIPAVGGFLAHYNHGFRVVQPC